jgi:hypothetical protein
LNAGFTCEIAISHSQRRLIVLASLALCAMGLSACQTTGAPEKHDAPGAAQSSVRAAALSALPHQAQVKGITGSPKQASRPDQPTVIGIVF